MAELKIRLQVDPQTGKKTVLIDYASEADALPMEHEEDHKQWVEEVLAHAGINPEDVDRVVVEKGAAEQPQEEPAQREALEQKS